MQCASWGRRLMVIVLVIGMMAVARQARAQRSGQMPQAFKNVGLDQKLGEVVPLDIAFQNEKGKEVQLGRYFETGKPVLLTLVYHDCPMLCNLVLDNLTRTMQDMSWAPGNQYELVTVSFNHRETPELARKMKKSYLERLGRPEAAKGWHFITGDKANIERLTDAVGFSYKWIERKKQYAHPAVLIFLNENGKIMRYLPKLKTPPDEVRKALVEASNGNVGNVLDQALLYCFQYDPNANSYVASAFNIMKLGSVLTMLVLGTGLFMLWRRERQGGGDHPGEENRGDQWKRNLGEMDVHEV